MRARIKFLLTFIYSKAYHIIINYIKSYMFGGMMQHEITNPQRLLDANGNIKEPGFAKKMLYEYHRSDVKAKNWRIKEWDYYYIGNQHYGLALTIGDNGFAGALSTSILEFDKPYDVTKTALVVFPLGKMNLPETSEKGTTKWTQGKSSYTFENDGKVRHLKGTHAKFDGDNALTFDITLSDYPEESMVIATPFDKNAHFYFNQKINCMRAEGVVKCGNKEWKFDKSDSMGTLDWGRGVWTYDNTWYWGSLQGYLEDGSRFGWNIGYGFGNTSAASENMLFYNGKSHKLDEVTFNIPVKNGKDDYMSPWTFTSNDGRFEMNFTPILDRQAPLNVGVICMLPHQVFGKFNGKAILDDGTVIEVKDMVGFAEKVHNKW